MHEHYSSNGGTPGPGVVNAGLVGIGSGLQRTGGPSYDDFTTTRAAIMRNTSSSSLSGSGASTPGTPGAAPYSPLMIHSHFVPAVPPSSSNLGDMRRSPNTAFNMLHAHSGLSPIPQSPPTAEDAATPMPIPRRVPQTPTLGEDGLPRSKDDYFSMSRSRQVSGQQPTSPGEESTSSGPSVVPASPSAASVQSPGASLMGKIKLFGRPKRTPSELATPGPITTTVPEEVAAGPTPDQLALHALLSAPLTPPSSTEAPNLALAPHTRIVMSEEAPPGWRTRAVTSVGSANLDMRAIEEWAPKWLLEYLLVNKTPQIGVPKLSFVLIPYEQGKETLPQLLNA
jgi:WD repeat-containing protein 48